MQTAPTKLFAFWFSGLYLLMSVGQLATAGHAAPPETAAARTQENSYSSQVAALILEKTNEFRRENGLANVETNRELAKTADYFAGYLAETSKFSHTADGKQPAERAKERGYDYCIVSENIAYQYRFSGFPMKDLAEKFVDGWKKSAGHRKNMLDPDVIEIGVAVAKAEKSGHYYAVQVFGRPSSKAIRFQVVNRSGATIKYDVGDRTYELPPRATMTHQSCRRPELTFQWPDKDRKEKVQAKSGARIEIVQNRSGEFAVREG